MIVADDIVIGVIKNVSIGRIWDVNSTDFVFEFAIAVIDANVADKLVSNSVFKKLDGVGTIFDLNVGVVFNGRIWCKFHESFSF